MNGERQGNGAGHHGFGERVDSIGESAQHLWTEARTAVTDLSSSLDLQGRVQRNPYGMVAAALGVGYLLGGGLFTPLTARMVRLGIRLAALPLVKDELLAMAEAALDGFAQGAADRRGAERSAPPTSGGGTSGSGPAGGGV